MSLLYTRLRAAEVAAVAALADLPVDRVTRAWFGYLPPETSQYEIDVTILPESGEGHPQASQDLEIRLLLRVFGRDPDGTRAFDNVRILTDIAQERLYADPTCAKLLGQGGQITWLWDFQADAGNPVVIATAETRCQIRHQLSVGPAVGLAARVRSEVPSHLAATSDLAEPTVYHVGLQLTQIAPATIGAFFAAAQVGDTLELRDAAGSTVQSTVLAATIGRHDFTEIPAGTYTLAIVRAGDVLAKSDEISVEETT